MGTTNSDTRERFMWLPSRAAVSMAITVGLLAAPAAWGQGQLQAQGQPQAQGQAQPQGPDPSDITEGMRLFQQKGNCQACHGWAGDGRKTDNQMPDGPNLRESRLSRSALVMTIKCGRLATQMPAFDKFAYSDGRCYGKTQADLKSYPTRMPDPPATLQQREIDLIADFLMAKVVGKGPMDHARCVEYWGSDVEACRDFPK
jgi:mono/diheme cytochrome c family protein